MTPNPRHAHARRRILTGLIAAALAGLLLSIAAAAVNAAAFSDTCDQAIEGADRDE